MICPECKSEFVIGILSCADCQVPLVEGKDLCNDCGAVNMRYEVCQTCGRVRHEGYRCFNHPEKIAKHVCVVCGFQLCDRCVRKQNGRYVCERHAGGWIDDNDFVRLYSTYRIIEAEFLKDLLQEKDIECHMFTFERFDLEDLNTHPSHMFPIKIFVPKASFQSAEDLINSLHRCSHCGVACLPDDDRCYNCAERFE